MVHHPRNIDLELLTCFLKDQNDRRQKRDIVRDLLMGLKKEFKLTLIQ